MNLTFQIGSCSSRVLEITGPHAGHLEVGAHHADTGELSRVHPGAREVGPLQTAARQVTEGQVTVPQAGVLADTGGVRSQWVK